MSANPGALPGWFNRRKENSTAGGETPTGNDDAVGDSLAQSSAHSTTGGGRDDQSPVVVWEAANRMEAEIVAGRLKSEGIPTIIRGEALGTIYGLTTGSLAAATVLVPAPLADKALAILASDTELEAEGEMESHVESETEGNDADDASPHHHG
jgi:hypothetical protein